MFGNLDSSSKSTRNAATRPPKHKILALYLRSSSSSFSCVCVTVCEKKFEAEKKETISF
jgi:hypothetical protein